MSWPDGLGTDLHLKGRARDLLTPSTVIPSSSQQADLYAVTGRERDIQRIEADPAPAGLRAAGGLAGRRQPPQGHRRGAARRGGERARPLHLLLDDLAGCHADLRLRLLPLADQLPGIHERLAKAPVISDGGHLLGLPAGLERPASPTVHRPQARTPRHPGRWPIRPTLSAGTSSTSLPPSPCGGPGASTSGTRGRSSRSTPCSATAAWDPDGAREVVHEYQMLGTADRSVGHAASRSRPSPACCPTPSARGGTQRRVDGGHPAARHAHGRSWSDCATPTAAPTSTTGCARWPRCRSSPRPCPAEPRTRRSGAPCPRQRRRSGAGRPRRFESEDELRILLDAALVVMERNGYADAAVADILREADLSTRSFYRHFESKDQLLCALFRREADAAAARLRAKVDAAATPRAALRRLDRRDPQLRPPPGQGGPRQRARVARRHEGRGLRRGDAPRRAHPDGAAGGAAAPTGAADGSFPLADPVADAPLDPVGGLGGGGAQSGPGARRPHGPRRRARCAPSASGRWG